MEVAVAVVVMEVGDMGAAEVMAEEVMLAVDTGVEGMVVEEGVMEAAEVGMEEAVVDMEAVMVELEAMEDMGVAVVVEAMVEVQVKV